TLSAAMCHFTSLWVSSGRGSVGGAIRYSPVTDWVGECSRSSVFPLPRYMCTPHGRPGSKLRTGATTSPPRKTRVETAHRAHDVDALEVLPVVLLEDRLALYRILVRPRCAVAVPRVGVPRGRRIRVVVGEFCVAGRHGIGPH